MFCRPALQGPGVWIWMERSLCAGRVPYPPGLRRRERPALRSRGNTAATRENAIPAAIANPCRGRCSHCARRRVSEANRTAGPALRPEIVPGCSRRRGVREGHAPPLHGIRARPAKWDCRSRPGERRAGCPHPAAPRGSAGFRGRDKSRPYGQILCSRQTGRPQCLPRFAGEGHGPPAGRGPRQGRPGRYGIGPYMGCSRRWECSRF